jgi:acetyl esterase/lipase
VTELVDRAIIYAEKEGFRALELDVHRPALAADPLPVVLYVHGGGWRVSSRQRTPRETRAWTPGFFEQIVDSGFVVVANDYRFSGEALYPAAVDDTADALAWTRAHAAEFGGDPARVVVWGQSAGGFLAASVGLAAAPGSVRGVVCWYPLTDLASLDPDDATSFEAYFLGGEIGGRLDLARAASPTSQVRPDAPPFLLQHGTADTMAPHDQSIRLRDALVAGGARVELESVDGAEHFFDGCDDTAVHAIFDRAIAFMRSVTT